MNLIFTVVFLLFTGNLFGVLTQGQTDRKDALEVFIDKHQPHQDTILLRSSIGKDISLDKNEFFREDFYIVERVRLAQAYAITLDQLNPKSDTLFKAAIQTALLIERRDLHIWANLAYGFYLYTYRLPAKAMPYFVRVMQEIDQLPESSIIQAADSYKKMAYFLTTLGDQQGAIQYLKLAQKHAQPESIALGDILNSIGRCYFKLQDYKQADTYYQQALKASQSIGDHLREAKVWGDLAELYQVRQEFGKAEQALQKDISLSEQYNNPQNTMYAQILLAKLMLVQSKFAQASAALDAAMAIATSKSYFKSSEYEIVKLQIKLFHAQDNDRMELYAHRRLDTLESQLAFTDGQGILKQVSMETQKETLNLNLEAERIKRRQETLIRRSVVAISLLLFVTVILVIIVYRRRNKLRLTNYENRVMKLQLEKVTSENKLNETRKTLSAYRDYLSDKNNQIETLRLEIEKSKKSSLSAIETSNGKLQELLQSHLMSEDNWQTFKEVFIQEEPMYYQYMMEHFEGLTDSNLRILFLQKMGFNNPRIAQILGITLDAVKKNKQRMRKKYGALYAAYYSPNKDEEEPNAI